MQAGSQVVVAGHGQPLQFEPPGTVSTTAERASGRNRAEEASALADRGPVLSCWKMMDMV